MRYLILALFLTGCAAREPSSTDRHDRIPNITCSMVVIGGSFHKECCDSNGRCFFAD